MPRHVTDIDTLQEYIQAVIGKAEHHAQGVDEIVLVIAGAIVWRKDSDFELRVMEREGRMTNVLWVRIGGNQYALSYNRTLQAVDVREENMRGEALVSFDNDTPVADVKRFFAGL